MLRRLATPTKSPAQFHATTFLTAAELHGFGKA
jgi:hypothetical protein